MPRIQSLEEFWPYYLSEHRDPRSRALHFVGTSLFLGSVVGSVITSPILFPAALFGMAGCAWWGSTRTEKERPAFVPLLGMVGIAMAASPLWIAGGVLGAYACAWVGHFTIEKNRPATFSYPVWSLLCDFRMWGHMARGCLWRGDPLEALGLG